MNSTTINENGSDYTANKDQTLYFTLTVYCDAPQVKALLREQADYLLMPSLQLSWQQLCKSLPLRDAIEPLLNDITDRERASRIEDFFLSTSNRKAEVISIHCPKRITWTTEGEDFEAQLARDIERDLHLRTFWYVHSNGALSYHMSFILSYDHRIEDYYFISMLQKACAPKEFRLDDADRTKPNRLISCFDGECRILPLTEVTIVADGKARPLWHYVRDRFNDHADALLSSLNSALLKHSSDQTRTRADNPAIDHFDTLVAFDEFIEVPGLRMPRARNLFLFQDKRFFELIKGRGVITENHESQIIAGKVSTLIDYASNDTDDADEARPVIFDQAFLHEQEAHADGLAYLFLSGFCQNIIDFLNQDPSEIRDSLDPIYPTNKEQEDEGFFYRFANPRSMTQFVPKSRSLATGNDYIGTCPYAYLVHAASLHNEFLTRCYESDIIQLKREVERHIAEPNFKLAAESFYRFRTGLLADYTRYRYPNVFRYDTEADCFDALERVRGIKRKTDYLNATIANLESTTRDLEERQRNEADDKRENEMAVLEKKSARLNNLVLIIGGFSILQVLFLVVDYMDKNKDEPILGFYTPTQDSVKILRQWLTASSVALFGVVLVFGIGLFARWLFGRGRSDP